MRLLMKTTAIILALGLGPALADDPLISALSEDDLRGLVAFGPDDQLKLAECDEKRLQTCAHIWGPPDADDATRIAIGGKPSGQRITLVAVASARPADFDRVLSSYSDAVPIEGFGPQAVWSAERAQISVRTEAGLILHVNVADVPSDDPLALSRAVLSLVLAQAG